MPSVHARGLELPKGAPWSCRQNCLLICCVWQPCGPGQSWPDTWHMHDMAAGTMRGNSKWCRQWHQRGANACTFASTLCLALHMHTNNAGGNNCAEPPVHNATVNTWLNCGKPMWHNAKCLQALLLARCMATADIADGYAVTVPCSHRQRTTRRPGVLQATCVLPMLQRAVEQQFHCAADVQPLLLGLWLTVLAT